MCGVFGNIHVYCVVSGHDTITEDRGAKYV